MKIRKDFVTNSSSSSYVIAYKEMPDFDEETINKFPFLSVFNPNRMIDYILYTEGDNNDTSIAEVYKTQEEYDRYFLDSYGWRGNTVQEILNNNPILIKEYERITKYIKEGYRIAIKDVDYCDNELDELISFLTKGNDYFIIVECE